jgi:hypothetical protein
MYYNHMPEMVRKLADSAGVTQKYQITMRALPGASLEVLWKDAEVQRLLNGEHWDDIIIQGETRARTSETNLASFQEYGARLIGKSPWGLEQEEAERIRKAMASGAGAGVLCREAER